MKRFQLGTLAILAAVLLSIFGIGCGATELGAPSALPRNCREVYHPATERTEFVRDQLGRLIPVIIRTPARTEIVCE